MKFCEIIITATISVLICIGIFTIQLGYIDINFADNIDSEIGPTAIVTFPSSYHLCPDKKDYKLHSCNGYTKYNYGFFKSCDLETTQISMYYIFAFYYNKLPVLLDTYPMFHRLCNLGDYVCQKWYAEELENSMEMEMQTQVFWFNKKNPKDALYRWNIQQQHYFNGYVNNAIGFLLITIAMLFILCVC